MAAMSNAVHAVERLRRARRAIIETAAEWQEAGLDTEPLNLPLIELQEAIFALEATDLEARAAASLSAYSKELRNHFNSVRVSGAGLESESNPAKRVVWLDLMEQAADRCIDTIGRMEPLLGEE
jgi:hypothetical protein